MTAPRPTAVRRIVALTACLAMVSSACMFKDDDDSQSVSGNRNLDPVESGMPDDPKPVRGGQVVYGLEAETDGGFCMPEAQMAISGIQVARSIYDSLTVPNAEGDYVPYLAKSVTPNDDYTEWTITLRPDIKFHDGTPLDAQVVKNNLDAYRGEYKGRASLLFRIVFRDIESIDVVNELTVSVKTSRPWVAFDAALYSSGRVLIVAQAQLDMPKGDCNTKPIGSGPFSFVSWDPGVSLKVRRWDQYWQIAPDDEPYPYLEAIDYRPMSNGDARITALQQGELNMMYTSTATDMADNLTQLRDAGEINLLISEERTETNYLMFNVNEPDVDNVEIRRAMAMSIDRAAVNEESNRGFANLANGPLAPEVLGYLEDPGSPKYDLDAAKKAVAAFKKAGTRTEFTFLTSEGPAAVRLSTVLKAQLEAAGWTINLRFIPEASLINEVINGNFEIAVFRNQPGDDPDSNFHWWYGENNLLNFGRFDDPVVNEALVKGRVSTDRDDRRDAYETVSKRIVSQVYNYYLWYSPWAVAEAANVHGILGPKLPHEDQEPPARLVTGHPMHGVWIDQS